MRRATSPHAVSAPQPQPARRGRLAHVVLLLLLLLAGPREHTRGGYGVEMHAAQSAGGGGLPALARGLVYEGGLAEGASTPSQYGSREGGVGGDTYFVLPVAWTVRPPCGDGVPCTGETPRAKGFVPVGIGWRGCWSCG
jgi:hypothetical protein